MLKKIKKWVPAAAAVMALLFASCEDSSSSSNNLGLLLALQNKGPTSSVTIEKHKIDDIVKNKVVSEDNVYYEYFKYTSEEGTSGEYFLYKKVGDELVKQTKSPIDDSDLPTTFTYDSTTGAYTVGTSTSYLFDAPKNGVKVNVIASELMTTTDTPVAFTSTWNTSDGQFIFDKASSVKWDEDTYKYEKNGGWIIVSDVGSSANNVSIPFYWDYASKFYYLVYETTRKSVTEVGRGLNENETLYTSPVFIYKKLNK